MKEPILWAMQFELWLMALNDQLMKEEDTNPNRMKIHWMNIAKIRKNIAKAIELHDLK